MGVVATIGFFDGVHRGHQFLLDHLIINARELRMKAVVVTFKEHPMEVLHSQFMPLLTTAAERKEILLSTGVDEVIELAFEEIYTMTAAEFMTYLAQVYNVEVLLMGYDHHFGSDRPMLDEDYDDAGRAVGIEVLHIPPSPIGEASSTSIRYLVAKGFVETAGAMLTRPYFMRGKVVHGKAVGRTIGYPTANLEIDGDKLLPAPGVYAVEVVKKGWRKPKQGILNIRMMMDDSLFMDEIEVHVLGYDGNLYDQVLEVRFLWRIRKEIQFANTKQLKAQIKKDIDALWTHQA